MVHYEIYRLLSRSYDCLTSSLERTTHPKCWPCFTKGCLRSESGLYSTFIAITSLDPGTFWIAVGELKFLNFALHSRLAFPLATPSAERVSSSNRPTSLRNCNNCCYMAPLWLNKACSCNQRPNAGSRKSSLL